MRNSYPNTDPKISPRTTVIIRRYIKNSYSQNPSISDQKTIAQAERDGDLSSSSGTVSVRITVADGEHAGANVYRDSSGAWRAQYDPDIELPNRTPRPDVV